MLERLDRKVTLLSGKLQQMQQQLELAYQERDDLLRENRALRSELEKSDLDNRYLRVSHKLADTPEAVVEARRLITSLMRSIDKCISELKE